MVITGAMAFIVMILSFLIFYSLKLLVMPTLSADSRDYMRWYKFMLMRFRAAKWYWGIVFLIRSLLIALSTTISASKPLLQMVMLCMIMVVYSVLLAYHWPWRKPVLNWLDAITGVCITGMVLGSIPFIGQPDADTRHLSIKIVMGFHFLCLGTLGGFFGYRLMEHLVLATCMKPVAQRRKSERGVRVAVFAEEFKYMIDSIQKKCSQQPELIKHFSNHINIMERNQIHRELSMILWEFGVPLTPPVRETNPSHNGVLPSAKALGLKSMARVREFRPSRFIPSRVSQMLPNREQILLLGKGPNGKRASQLQVPGHDSMTSGISRVEIDPRATEKMYDPRATEAAYNTPQHTDHEHDSGSEGSRKGNKQFASYFGYMRSQTGGLGISTSLGASNKGPGALASPKNTAANSSMNKAVSSQNIKGSVNTHSTMESALNLELEGMDEFDINDNDAAGAGSSTDLKLNISMNRPDSPKKSAMKKKAADMEKNKAHGMETAMSLDPDTMMVMVSPHESMDSTAESSTVAGTSTNQMAGARSCNTTTLLGAPELSLPTIGTLSKATLPPRNSVGSQRDQNGTPRLNKLNVKSSTPRKEEGKKWVPTGSSETINCDV
jgi:hypothetical protein